MQFVFFVSVHYLSDRKYVQKRTPENFVFVAGSIGDWLYLASYVGMYNSSIVDRYMASKFPRVL